MYDLTLINLIDRYYFTNTNLKHLEAISKCIEMNWMCILVGRSYTGKTTLVRILANLLGVNLVEFSVNNSTDTSDLLGGFEKVKHQKNLILNAYERLKSIYMAAMARSDLKPRKKLALLRSYFSFVFESRNLLETSTSELAESEENTVAALKLFRRKLEIWNSFNLDGIITYF